jgi:hypothetical protein
VILRDVWDHRRGRPKEEPTVGEYRRAALAEHERVDAAQPASTPAPGATVVESRSRD